MLFLALQDHGKSTMLNVLSGIDKPTSGKITYFNKEIGKLSDKELTLYRKNNLGFIFQSYKLYFHKCQWSCKLLHNHSLYFICHRQNMDLKTEYATL